MVVQELIDKINIEDGVCEDARNSNLGILRQFIETTDNELTTFISMETTELQELIDGCIALVNAKSIASDGFLDDGEDHPEGYEDYGAAAEAFMIPVLNQLDQKLSDLDTELNDKNDGFSMECEGQHKRYWLDLDSALETEESFLKGFADQYIMRSRSRNEIRLLDLND